MSGAHRDLLPPSLRPFTGPIYHYTSATGLIGMICNGVIWASEASSLNDLAEIRGGWDLVDRWASQLPTGEPLLDVVKGARLFSAERQADLFVACCSTEPDDAAQWRAYAKGGLGYAVQLDPTVPLAVWSKYSKAASVKRSSRPTPHFSTAVGDVAWVTDWLPIIYQETEAFIMLDEVLDAARAQSENIENTGRGTGTEDDLRDYQADAYAQLRDDLTTAISVIAHLIKGPGFSGEHEVRAVASMLLPLGHLRFRSGATGAIAYLTLAGTKRPRLSVSRPTNKKQVWPGQALPIRSVTLGPLLAEENKTTVRRLLNANRLTKAEVERSKLEMR